MLHAVLYAGHTLGKREQGFDVGRTRAYEFLRAMRELDAVFFHELKRETERSFGKTNERRAIFSARIR